MAFTYTTRKDGRLMKRVSINGKIQSIYATNPKDLEKQYIEKKHLANKGIFADDNGLNMEEWSKKWLELYKSDKQSATKNMYSDAIKLYIIPQLGHLKLKYIKESDIQSVLTKLNNKPRQKEIVLLTIKQILERAVDNDYIYKNVARAIRLKRYKAKEKQRLSDLEIDYLKKVAETDNRCFMLLFMLYTGIRKEEVAPLQYKDIDLENRKVKIHRAVHWSHNQPIIKTTKNEDIRELPILDVIFPKIKQLKEIHHDSDFLFPMATQNKIMTATSMKRLLEYTLKKINILYSKGQKDQQEKFDTPENVSTKTEIKTITFTYHQLRHTYACFLHKAGIDLKEAQYLTGHRDLRVLMDIYTHLDAEDHKNASDKLNLLVKI